EIGQRDLLRDARPLYLQPGRPAARVQAGAATFVARFGLV
ncbi:hypothetical protein AVDCRST_MAG82-1391, partial [uncultured Rubrobacteraceae bacterium]